MSIGGYWPSHYRYRRYYWYGYHPYTWYGHSLAPYEYTDKSVTYYTYNNYDLAEIDENTFADVRERMKQQQQQEPQKETQADKLFERGVESFEKNQYARAAEHFREAMKWERDDVVLPFAYVQALFADGRYAVAADQLRLALKDLSGDELSLYFPRGLYESDDKLFKHIDALAIDIERRPFDSSLRLLMGYQLLGVDRRDEARGYLEQAKESYRNKAAAEKFLTILNNLPEKMKGGD